MFCFQCKMLHNHNEESRKDEVCEDCEERNSEKRTSEAIAEGDKDDTGSNLTSCEHTDAESKTLC